MEIQLTLSPNYILFGFDLYSKDFEFDYNEVNIYFLFAELKITWD